MDSVRGSWGRGALAAFDSITTAAARRPGRLQHSFSSVRSHQAAWGQAAPPRAAERRQGLRYFRMSSVITAPERPSAAASATPILARDFPGWLPPMLVKELRQGLRTR